MNMPPKSDVVKEKSPLQAFFFHPPFESNFWPDILDEIYKKQIYLPYLPKNKESVCIEIGSNIGLATYYFAKYFKTTYALEPAVLHLEALNRMVEENKLSNVIVVPYAISNKNGKEKFYHNVNTTMFSLEKSVNNQDDFEEVDTIAMDTLFEKYKINEVALCKIDCEGSEGILVNSEGFKKVAPKIRVIVFEFHDWANCSQANFQHALEDLGYEVRWRRDTLAKVGTAVRI